MNFRKRKIMYSFLAAVFIMAGGMFISQNVQAAALIASCTINDVNAHVGKYCLYVGRNNKLYISTKPGSTGKALVSPGAKESFGSYVFTDGIYVYYTLTKKGASTTNIYRINIKSKAKNRIQSYPSSYGDLVAYSKERLVLGKGKDEFYANGYYQNLYSYVSAKKSYVKLKKAGPTAGLRQYGDYLVYRKIYERGDNWSRGFYSYDLDAGETVEISKKAKFHDDAAVIDGKIYYKERDKISSSTYEYTLKSCEMDGKNKKTLGSIKLKSDVLEVYFFKDYAVCDYFNHYGSFHGYYFDYTTKKWKNKISYAYWCEEQDEWLKNADIYYMM